MRIRNCFIGLFLSSLLLGCAPESIPHTPDPSPTAVQPTITAELSHHIPQNRPEEALFASNTSREAAVISITPLGSAENIQFVSAVERQPVETFSIMEKASQFGAPYDEEYTLLFDTSVWQSLITYQEGDWMISQLTTSQAPVCTIQVKVLMNDTRAVQTIKELENRYRRMGVFTSSNAAYDVFFYTSDSEGLADTQNVVYILTAANGDQPYLVKPQFRAYSSYDEWEYCRPLVRAALSRLVMKRIPIIP